MVGTIIRETKGNAKRKPKDAQPTRTKERRELIPFVVGCYLTWKSLYYHLHANHEI
jgi:hypothetical protein